MPKRDASSVPADERLTEKQSRLVDLVCNGVDLTTAYKLAGYQSGYEAKQFLGSPKGAVALHSRLSERLQHGAAVAFNLLEGIIRGTIPAPAAARVKAALAWLDRAGFTGHKPQEIQAVGRSKALSEMTVDELRTAVAGLRQLAKGQAPAPDASLDDMLA